MFGKKRIDFLVIGAQKAGTSSFYRYLTANLMINAAHRKELHFFDIFYQRGKRWYHRHFDFARNRITGESSPFYLLHPKVAVRVRSYRPDIKLIVLLRNPVDRAFSHYLMNVATGRENLSFKEALQLEEERISGEIDLADPENPLLVYSYKQRGLYADQLEHWLQHFPMEQILLINYHSFFQDPWTNIQKVYRFLDAAPYFGSMEDFKDNASDLKQDMSLEDKKYLEEFFKQPNQKLQEKFNIHFD